MTMKDCERCPDCHGSGWSASTAYHIGRSGGCPTCQGVGAIPKQPTTGAITRAFRVDKHRDNGKSAIKWTNDAATYISLYKTAPNKRQPKSLKVLRHYHDAGRKP
jgi:DnaJ-class molecular chaperone